MTSKPISSFFTMSKRLSEGSDAPSSPKRQKLTGVGGIESQPQPQPQPPQDNTGEAVNQSHGWGSNFLGMESSWKARLLPELNKPYMRKLAHFLDGESSKFTIFPPITEVWTAFNICPYDKVKVVIIGQDPYHGPNQAHGLAFSVAKGVQIPPSLRNMLTEASRDPLVAIPAKPSHGNLECWARQGVLMLNTCLTVRKGEANSHNKQGWEDFTDAVVRELGKRNGIVYLLWGNPAQTKCKTIDSKKNHIIKSSHPSPLGAYKTSEPFMGSCCFSRCNAALVEMQQTPIDWRIV